MTYVQIIKGHKGGREKITFQLKIITKIVILQLFAASANTYKDNRWSLHYTDQEEKCLHSSDYEVLSLQASVSKLHQYLDHWQEWTLECQHCCSLMDSPLKMDCSYENSKKLLWSDCLIRDYQPQMATLTLERCWDVIQMKNYDHQHLQSSEVWVDHCILVNGTSLDYHYKVCV